MPDAAIKIVLEEAQYRRLVALAGRRQKSVDQWVSEIVERVIAAEQPGKINAELNALERPILRVDPPQRPCKFCGQPLDRQATTRRAYCSDVCRVRAWRQLKSANVDQR
jgi:hypothetical protein